MKLSIRYHVLSVFISICFFQTTFIQASAIQPDEEGLSTVQADLERIKLGLTELQERTMHISPTHAKIEAFHSQYKDMTLKFGGKCTEEIFNSANLTFLNNDVPNDTGIFARTTGDFFMDVAYGKHDKPRILFHETLRIRYKWGSGADVKIDGESLPVVDAAIQSRGSMVNKHLIWNRELWLKFALGNLELPHDHFVEIGSFPFEVGRGISFGAAYKSAGFLGFTPSFSIDQFAPGFLLHMNPLPDKLFFEGYFAVLDNQNISYKANNAKVRIQEIGTPDFRGTNRQSYATIIKAFWNVINESDNTMSFEPYAIYFQSLDQKLEYIHDIDSFVTTFGFAVEGKYKKLDWGFEAAINQGDILIKALDRNTVKLARNSDGFIVEQYSKVFSQDPALVKCPSAALVSDANKCIVASGPKDVSDNGKEINDSGLYSAYDRFRPEQQKNLDGYMFIGDFSYQFIDDILNISVGTGYASGDISQQQNVNNADSTALLDQKYNGFVTLQSIYSGKRLRHLIIFNEGAPRFNTLNPNQKFPDQNITPPLADSAIEFTNIAFLGTRVELRVPQWKRYKAVLAPNIIGYWCPVTPNTKAGVSAGNYMGTEVTTELSAQFYGQFKLYGYIGVLFPGSYYKDMCGTPYNGEVTGSDIGYLANIGVSFAF